MFKSIKFAISFAFICFLLILSIFLILFSSVKLKEIITAEKSQDFNERLRIVVDELDKTATDIESSGMGLFLSTFQDEAIELLRLRYYSNDGSAMESYPFIFDKTGQIIMHPSLERGETIVDETFVNAMIEDEQGELDVLWMDKERYMVFRSFNQWDWTIVFTIPNDEKYQAVNQFISKLVTTMIISLLVVVASIYFILQKMLKPLKVVSGKIQEISLGEGDLTSHLESRGQNEISILSSGFNDFVSKLREIVVAIKDRTNLLTSNNENLVFHSHETWSAMEEIVKTLDSMRKKADNLNDYIDDSNSQIKVVTTAIHDLEKESHIQSSALVQSSASVEEMVSSINNVARITENRQKDSEKLLKVTEQGKNGIGEVRSIISTVTSRMSEMQEIILVIKHINQQLNLLSMNAAIEAAHAGDAGKGFGVVADEIRKLSEGTSQSSKDVDSLISSVVGEIQHLDEIGEKSSQSFDSIQHEVKVIYDAILEISNSMREMDSGSKEIMTALSELKEITTKTNDITDRTKHSSEKVLSSFSGMTGISKDVDNAVQEIFLSANQVNDAMKNVNSLVEESTSSTEEVQEILSKFKTE